MGEGRGSGFFEYIGKGTAALAGAAGLALFLDAVGVIDVQFHRRAAPAPTTPAVPAAPAAPAPAPKPKAAALEELAPDTPENALRLYGSKLAGGPYQAELIGQEQLDDGVYGTLVLSGEKGGRRGLACLEERGGKWVVDAGPGVEKRKERAGVRLARKKVYEFLAADFKEPTKWKKNEQMMIGYEGISTKGRVKTYASGVDGELAIEPCLAVEFLPSERDFPAIALLDVYRDGKIDRVRIWLSPEKMLTFDRDKDGDFKAQELEDTFEGRSLAAAGEAALGRLYTAVPGVLSSRSNGMHGFYPETVRKRLQSEFRLNVERPYRNGSKIVRELLFEERADGGFTVRGHVDKRDISYTMFSSKEEQLCEQFPGDGKIWYYKDVNNDGKMDELVNAKTKFPLTPEEVDRRANELRYLLDVDGYARKARGACFVDYLPLLSIASVPKEKFTLEKRSERLRNGRPYDIFERFADGSEEGKINIGIFRTPHTDAGEWWGVQLIISDQSRSVVFGIDDYGADGTWDYATLAGVRFKRVGGPESDAFQMESDSPASKLYTSDAQKQVIEAAKQNLQAVYAMFPELGGRKASGESGVVGTAKELKRALSSEEEQFELYLKQPRSLLAGSLKREELNGVEKSVNGRSHVLKRAVFQESPSGGFVVAGLLDDVAFAYQRFRTSNGGSCVLAKIQKGRDVLVITDKGGDGTIDESAYGAAGMSASGQRATLTIPDSPLWEFGYVQRPDVPKSLEEPSTYFHLLGELLPLERYVSVAQGTKTIPLLDRMEVTDFQPLAARIEWNNASGGSQWATGKIGDLKVDYIVHERDKAGSQGLVLLFNKGPDNVHIEGYRDVQGKLVINRTTIDGDIFYGPYDDGNYDFVLSQLRKGVYDVDDIRQVYSKIRPVFERVARTFGK